MTGDEAVAGATSGEPPRATTAFRKTAGALGRNVRGPAREGMARAFQTGVYTMKAIADYFGAHDSTVSRAVRWFEQTCAGNPR